MIFSDLYQFNSGGKFLLGYSWTCSKPYLWTSPMREYRDIDLRASVLHEVSD